MSEEEGLRLINRKEVALLIRRSTQWVSQNAKEIPGHIRIGKRDLFDKDVLINTVRSMAMQKYGNPAMPKPVTYQPAVIAPVSPKDVTPLSVIAGGRP